MINGTTFVSFLKSTEVKKCLIIVIVSLWGLSNGHTDNQKLGIEEEPLDGHDIELTGQVPYLPWARVTGRRYWWKTKTASEDIKGWEASINMDLF